jgi:serine-type D-Ala-D-Ala carboxypeptidase (penicillin-binding protein 5/6)
MALYLMRRFSLLLCAALFLSSRVVFASPPPEITAAGAILIDAATGQILYEKDARTSRPIASTTKIMTALLTIEHCSPEEMVTMKAAAGQTDGSQLGMQLGDRLPVETLLQALLMKSANDVALALADHVAGSEAKFVALMNQRAQALGAKDTHFSNPHGLYADDHYSSACDLALIAREAMQYRRFRCLVATRTAELRAPNGSPFLLINHNRLLFRDEAVDGIKTGFVRQSGPCLVASASHAGWRLISVVLNSKAMYDDTEALFDYGFSNWEATVFASQDKPVTEGRIFGGGLRKTPLFPARDLLELRASGTAPRLRAEMHPARMLAPVELHQAAGYISLLEGNKEVARVALLTGAATPRAAWYSALLLAGGGALPLCGLVFLGIKSYGKIAKTARRRRSYLPAQGRRVNYRGPRVCGWEGYHPAGNESGPEPPADNA